MALSIHLRQKGEELVLTFKEALVRANEAEKTGAPILIADVDRLLHAERARKDGAKVTFDAALCSHPVGAMFEHQDTAYLVSPHGFLPWSFSGHGGRADMDTAATVAVLTPRSVVQAFAHGFEPKFHSSANALRVEQAGSSSACLPIAISLCLTPA